MHKILLNNDRINIRMDAGVTVEDFANIVFQTPSRHWEPFSQI